MTNIPGGYIPISPINPFHYLITLEMCVIYMTELSWACQVKTNVLAFSFFLSLKPTGTICKKINNLTLFKNTLFCGAYLFFIYLISTLVESVIVISFGINFLV